MLVVRILAIIVGIAIGSLARLHVAQSATPSPSAIPTAATSTAPSPDEIYSRSLREMRALARTGNPPFLVFDLQLVSHNLHWYPQTDDGSTDWEVKLVHANETENYRIWYRSKDESALVQDDSTHAAYKGESPFAPETTDFTDASGTKPTPAPSPSPAATSSTKAGDAPARVIGAVTVDGSKYYSITLAGVEPRDGHQTYHLHLRAYRDAIDYPLTDLWVDTSDYRIVGAHGEVTVRAVAALLGVGVTAEFEQADKYWLVSTIDLTMKGYIAFWHANTETAMKASVVSVPATLPASYFPTPTPSPKATTTATH